MKKEDDGVGSFAGSLMMGILVFALFWLLGKHPCDEAPSDAERRFCEALVNEAAAKAAGLPW